VKEDLLRGLARLQVDTLGKRAPGMWLQKIAIEDTYNRRFGPNAPPNTWLSRDAPEVDKYNHDPWCGFPLTSQAWLDMLEARKAQGSAEFFRRIPNALPIHIIYGTDDSVGEQGMAWRVCCAFWPSRDCRRSAAKPMTAPATNSSTRPTANR
jgi:alpha-beta hydrolase superfamily lysophospholipase